MGHDQGPSSHELDGAGGAQRATQAPQEASSELVIRPYPVELEEHVQLRGQDLVLRPLRADDAAMYRRFIGHIAPEDLYARFFVHVHALPEEEIDRLIHVDYERQMAFVAVGRDANGVEEILGVVRACRDADNVSSEFGILVRSDLKHHGLGSAMIHKLIRYCRATGTRRIWGFVLPENAAMLQLAKSTGFRVRGVECNLELIELDLPGDHFEKPARL